jgi:hypothetical protein
VIEFYLQRTAMTGATCAASYPKNAHGDGKQKARPRSPSSTRERPPWNTSAIAAENAIPVPASPSLTLRKMASARRLVSAFPVVRMIGDDTFRGETMRYLAELPWIPDALLFNTQLSWRVIDTRTLAVATGKGARRSEVRITLNEAGDPITGRGGRPAARRRP